MTQPTPAQQQPAQPAVFYASRPVTLIRVLFFIAFVCFLIAALSEAFHIHIGPALAWAFGGFAAWMLTGAV